MRAGAGVYPDSWYALGWNKPGLMMAAAATTAVSTTTTAANGR